MRVLLKISWEALAGGKWFGLDPLMLDGVTDLIKDLITNNVEVGIVVGAGNFIRGEVVAQANIDRCNADNMGMLAININAIALSDILEKKWIPARVVNSFTIDGIADRFNKQTTISMIKNKNVIIFGGGTWNPYFTTDTAGVLRALEIDADLMIKATKVDGVYTSDPMTHPDAEFIAHATYDEVLSQNLRVMDTTAIALAKENNLTLKVVNMYKQGAIKRAVSGLEEGTTISE